MNLSLEVYTFFLFVIIGIIISILFDFFRAIRLRKVYSDRSIAFQDILFWLLTGFIITFSIITFLNEKLRIYIFIAMILGSFIYILFFSKYMLMLFEIILKYLSKIIKFVFVPILYLYKIVEKIIKRYCIKAKDVIFYIHKILTKAKK